MTLWVGAILSYAPPPATAQNQESQLVQVVEFFVNPGEAATFESARQETVAAHDAPFVLLRFHAADVHAYYANWKRIGASSETSSRPFSARCVVWRDTSKPPTTTLDETFPTNRLSR